MLYVRQGYMVDIFLAVELSDLDQRRCLCRCHYVPNINPYYDPSNTITC